MAISGIDPQAFLPTQITDVQNQKPLAPARPSEEPTKRTQDQSTLRGPSPIQDQVTLSQDAQTLSAANPQSSRNNTFQDSPFDR